MHSEVRVKSDSFKLYLSIGLFATIVIIFLAVWFSFEFSVILLSASGIMTVAGLFGAYNRFLIIRHSEQLRKFEIIKEDASARVAIAEARRAELSANVFVFENRQRALIASGSDMRLIEAIAGGGGEAIQPLALPTGSIELLPLLDRAERVLVKGPSDSGKSTLFCNVAARTGGDVIVIDPHYKPGIWPENCQIVGKGRNHEEISRFLDWLSSELDRRYKLRATGNEDYGMLTVIVDEWMSISNKCDNATDVITEMITESRKSKMRLFIGSHSDQVEALGIRGQGKLREGLLIVRLYYDQFTQEHSATYDYGRGERPCYAPANAPFFAGDNDAFDIPALAIEPDEVITKKLSARQKRILDLLNQGKTDNQIAEAEYKTSRLVGSHFYEVKAMKEYATYT